MKTESTSKLLNYISLLMHNDEALQQFIVDPITAAENQHGITKAERAVLRRSVHGLSNNSVNGYSLQRNLDSYRRSLRLLQNVLHNVGTKMTMDHTETADGMYNFTVFVYFPYVTNTADANFTGKTNADVANFRGPYATHYVNKFVATLANPNPTIQEVMNASGLPKYQTVHLGEEDFVSGFQVSAFYITADLSNPAYDLSKNPNADCVFWFYTINGTPNKGGTPNPGGSSGYIGESFATKTLNPGDTVFWQLIAPDAKYGFKSCAPHENNQFAINNRK